MAQRWTITPVLSMKFEGCPKCHGMWLVKDELRKLKNKALEGQLHWRTMR
jgi:Zn-finger nucleic acid-binding protein